MRPDDTPFFIIGAGRSGTTLLRLMLAKHSRLHIPAETWFLRSLVERFTLTEALSATEVAEAVQLVTEHYRWPDMNMSTTEFKSRVAVLRAPKLKEIVNVVYSHQLSSHGKSRIGDKTPNYFDLVPQLATLYQGCKFIHLMRDGRDVAISNIDVGWARYYEKQFRWTQAMKTRRFLRTSPHAGDILDVRYEDLISQPEPTLTSICEFLGEKFQAQMLDWTGSIDGLIPARERAIHPKIDKPLSMDAIAIWKHKLSTIECFAMEACLGEDLRDSGYALRFGARYWRPVLFVSRQLLRGAAPILNRAVPYLQRRSLLPKGAYF